MDLDPEFISVAAWASFAIHPLGHDVEIGFVDAEDHRFILKLHPNSTMGPNRFFGLDGWKIDAGVLALCAAG